MVVHFTEQKQLQAMLLDKDWDVFGTLKFQPIRMIGGQYAHKLLRHYWNQLDRVLFGKAVKHGCRVERWCFAHEGSSNDNYHVHFVAKAPIELDAFCCLANTLWTKQHRATASILKNEITPVVHKRRTAFYMTKEVWKLGGTSYDPLLSYENATALHGDDDDAARQADRIAIAMSANEFRAAHTALIQHKADVEHRFALRAQKQRGKATCK